MSQIITALAAELNSSVFILLLMLVGVYVAIARFYKWLGATEEKEKGVSARLKRVEDKVDSLIEDRGKLDIVYQSTLEANRRITASSSPVSLTKVGEEVAQKLNAYAIVDRSYSRILDQLYPDGVNDNNAYDIQTRVFEYFSRNIEEHLTEEEAKKFKNEAFQRGVLVSDFYRALAVIFRDKLLKEQNISISEIDKHDPNIP